MRKWGGRIAILSFACGFGVALATGEGKPKVRLADLAWLQGDWRANLEGGDQLQEFWAAPAGDSMVGMFRWMKKDGRVSLFELITIVEESGELTYRFRHFGRDMKASEEKDSPLTFQVSRAGDREFVFTNPSQTALMKLTYRQTGADTMTVRVGGGEGETPKEFQFTKIKSAAP